MTTTKAGQDLWLLLLYSLPAKRTSARVSLWRQLKKAGALPFKTSATLLPDTTDHYERFQWVAQQVRDSGGEATLLRVTDIEGFGRADIVRQFNEARAKDYDALVAELTNLVAENKRKMAETFPTELEKHVRQFDEIRKIDFFGCPRAQDAQMLLQRAAALGGAKGKLAEKLSAKKFLGSTWLTRPRPQIDRVGSAWLIRRFIDPKATFVFDNDPKPHPTAIPYDMFEVEFSHHGEDCTFETLVKRFGITDKAVLKMAEMVHDTDLEDGKFQTTECVGIDRLLKGWAKTGLSDADLLARGSECFEALYHSLR
jgi:hypothetical protein